MTDTRSIALIASCGEDARVPEQPGGTVTLVFTDIENSTRLLHELGQEAYREALAQHRQVVRAAFARHSGYEVDYEGDAFFYAFPDAGEAVTAVAEAMRGLESGPIRIRVGLNTGEPGLDPPKYVGMDVHVAARVMSVGYGGQVLLSQATRELVDVELKDLGEHRLKDIADPVWLYQLGKGEFPPLKSLNNTNLPTPASSFLGRDVELEEADRLLSRGRLLTVSGPGGAGKTRFAIELASRQLSRFPNGVFWVSLAALREPALVIETIAQMLGARDGLADYIGPRRMLLLLDNLEQVIEAAPELSELVAACENLTLLVTSRELLRVEGEVEFALPPLAPGAAVELFCERARCEPSIPIEQLSVRLDGLPLAIELAAARMSVFTPEQLLERLAQRLDLFRGRRDADPRQRTLRATIQWSYDLLAGGEASLFRRLAVFAGGWTLEAAEDVDDAHVDVLQSLVEKSLLRHTGNRFSMLETIREFALEQLEGEGETAAARSAYCTWMLRLADEAREGLEGASQGEWLDRLHEEHGNVREVLTLALDAADGELALGIAIDLVRDGWLRPGEALGWLERGLELRDRLPPELVADALRAAGETAWFAGDPARVTELVEDGLAIYEQLGDERGIAKMYNRLGPPLQAMGRLDDAAAVIEKAAALLGRLGEDRELAIALNNLGSVTRMRGDLGRARYLLESAIALNRKLGDLQATRMTLDSLADMWMQAGDLERGISFSREALEIAWANRDLISVAVCFGRLAVAASGLGNVRGAAMFWGAAERLDAELGQTVWRNRRASCEARLSREVLTDEEGLATGRALRTAKAVEFALGS